MTEPTEEEIQIARRVSARLMRPEPIDLGPGGKPLDVVCMGMRMTVVADHVSIDFCGDDGIKSATLNVTFRVLGEPVTVI